MAFWGTNYLSLVLWHSIYELGYSIYAHINGNLIETNTPYTYILTGFVIEYIDILLNDEASILRTLWLYLYRYTYVKAAYCIV